MATSEPKTTRTKKSVSQFIATLKEPGQRKDSKTLVSLMRKVTGKSPAMWGPSIVGFGSYHYVYASGREGDMPIIGFSPRKGTMTLYLMAGLHGRKDLLQRLGKHSTGKGCLYLATLEGVDVKALEELIGHAVQELKELRARIA